jgi:flagellar biogenesis protein FliO
MNSLSQVEMLPGTSSEIASGKASSQSKAGLQILAKQFLSSMSWALKKIKVQPARKTLRLCENLALGEKRFVAVIQVESERFLIGGAPGSVSLLTRLQETPDFSKSLQGKLDEGASR